MAFSYSSNVYFNVDMYAVISFVFVILLNHKSLSSIYNTPFGILTNPNKYVYVNVAAKPGVKLLQGDKIETPDYILKNKLQINYTHYITNQLMKPLQQLFGLALEQIWEYQKKPGAIKTYKKEMKEAWSLLGKELEKILVK